MAASESYPDGLQYHPEHDWARIDGDEAVLGVTWYAQDALGELVHYEAPDVGSTVTKDSSYGEVESVKAVSDLIAPLSGEVLEVGIGLGYVPAAASDAGTPLIVDVRGRAKRGEVVKKPIYKREE